MFGRISAIALNTYRESLRARILIGLAGVAFAVAFYSIIVGAYTLRNGARVVSDLGVASISLFGIAVAVIIGATSLYRELEQKTIFPILARPLRRGEYLVGKYLGTLLTLAVFILADAGLVLLISAVLAGRSLGLVAGAGAASLAALGLAAWRSPPLRTYGFIPWAAVFLVLGALLADGAPTERRVVLAGSALAFLEVGVVAAVATLFSSFSTPFLSSLLTLGVFLIGRNADSLARLPVKYFGPQISAGAHAFSKVVPNLQIYVPPRPLLAGEVADANLLVYLGWAAITCAGWALALLAVASFVFKKRDFL
ncbi:ABC transporter permease [Sorangium sp. So ce1000]|jgi:ABC-type transport system involved in multi-copper enzyme maturation permease subunit|uniref:ABC transporter permease n=1 Tax=Sorangium sp. So ce1000 TaxID=3133325 RepID=UPI003F5F7408